MHLLRGCLQFCLKVARVRIPFSVVFDRDLVLGCAVEWVEAGGWGAGAVLIPGTWAASVGDLSRTCLPQMLKWAEWEHSHQEMNSRVLLPRACPSKTPRPVASVFLSIWFMAASSQLILCTRGKRAPQLGPAHTPGTPLSLQVDQISAVILCEAAAWGEGGWVFAPSGREVQRVHRR